MSEEKVTVKENSSSKLWVWILAAILLALAVLFVLDKIRSNKRIKNLEDENQRISADFLKYKSENDSYRENFTDLQQRYSDLSSKYQDSTKSMLSEVQRLKSMSQKNDTLYSKISQSLKSFIKNDELKIDIREGKVYVTMLDKLLFKSGSVEVEKKGIQALKALAKELSSYPDFGITVEGHTDNIPISSKNGVFADNWDLSTKRATNVVRILSEAGIPQKRLTASGKGEFQPVASNKDEAGRSKNRRTEVILTPNLDEFYNAVIRK